MSIVVGKNRCNKVAKSLINPTYRPCYFKGGFRVSQIESSIPSTSEACKTNSLSVKRHPTIPARHYSSEAPTPIKTSQASYKKPVAPDTHEVAVAAKKSKPKEPFWSKVKSEVKHYVNGTKLLGYEVKVSMKLLMKFAKGYELSRRETNQLQRTMSDVFRLVPFSAFIIIPFAELLLPIVLKIFPNMLPSTYESGHEKQKKKVRLDEIRQKNF